MVDMLQSVLPDSVARSVSKHLCVSMFCALVATLVQHTSGRVLNKADQVIILDDHYTLEHQLTFLIAGQKNIHQVNISVWNTLSTSDFQEYAAVVIAKKNCMAGDLDIFAPSASTWGNAIDGVVVLSGADEFGSAFDLNGKSFDALSALAQHVLSNPEGTGLYFSLGSCFTSAPSGTQLTLLNQAFPPANFIVQGVPSTGVDIGGEQLCNDASLVADVLSEFPLSDATFSEWHCASTSVFTNFVQLPQEFTPVVLLTSSTGNGFVSLRGITGYPYILATESRLITTTTTTQTQTTLTETSSSITASSVTESSVTTTSVSSSSVSTSTVASTSLTSSTTVVSTSTETTATTFTTETFTTTLTTATATSTTGTVTTVSATSETSATSSTISRTTQTATTTTTTVSGTTQTFSTATVSSVTSTTRTSATVTTPTSTSVSSTTSVTTATTSTETVTTRTHTTVTSISSTVSSTSTASSTTVTTTSTRSSATESSSTETVSTRSSTSTDTTFSVTTTTMSETTMTATGTSSTQTTTSTTMSTISTSTASTRTSSTVSDTTTSATESSTTSTATTSSSTISETSTITNIYYRQCLTECYNPFSTTTTSSTTTATTTTATATSMSQTSVTSSTFDLTHLCGIAELNTRKDVSCPVDEVISSIQFLSFGTATGSCTDGVIVGGPYRTSDCHSAALVNPITSSTYFENACLGRNGCAILAFPALFEPLPTGCNVRDASVKILMKCTSSSIFTTTATQASTTAASTIRPSVDTVCDDWARFTTSQGDFHYISSVSGDYGAFPWVIAEQFCQSLGGHLASIHTTEENDFVHSLFSSTAVAANEGQYWIGATRNRVDDSNRLPFTYTFTDGSGSIANLLNTANHSVFRTDEPDDLPCGVAAFADGNACQGQEGCISVRTSTTASAAEAWQDTSCSDHHHWVCKRAVPPECTPSTTQTTAQPTQPVNPCDGWEFGDVFGLSVQYFYSGNNAVSPRTFNDAEAYCQVMGAHLATVASQTENIFIASLERNNLVSQARWIGLRRNRVDDSNQYPFTFVNVNGSGSTTAYEQSFGCQPGVRVSSSQPNCAWQPGQPDDFPCGATEFPCQGQDDCVAIGGGEAVVVGQWQDLQCKNTLPFVCARQTPQECIPTSTTSVTTTTTTATTFSCEDHCAKLYVGEDALFPPTKTSSSSSTQTATTATTETITSATTVTLTHTSTTDTTGTFTTITSTTLSATTSSTSQSTTASSATSTTGSTTSHTTTSATTSSTVTTSSSVTSSSVSSTMSSTTATSVSSTTSETATSRTSTSTTTHTFTTTTTTSIFTSSVTATTVTISTCEMHKCGLCCQGVCGWKTSADMCVPGQRTTTKEKTAGDCTGITTEADCPVLNLSYLGAPPTEAPDPCHATPCARCCRTEDGCGWSRKNNRCETGQFTSPAEFGLCNSGNASVCTSCELACGPASPELISLAPTPPPSSPVTEENCNAIICAACCRGDCGWKSNGGMCTLNQKTTNQELEMDLCAAGYNSTECDDCVLSCPDPTCALITCADNCKPPCGWSSKSSTCVLGGHTRQNELGLGTC